MVSRSRRAPELWSSRINLMSIVPGGETDLRLSTEEVVSAPGPEGSRAAQAVAAGAASAEGRSRGDAEKHKRWPYPCRSRTAPKRHRRLVGGNPKARARLFIRYC